MRYAKKILCFMLALLMVIPAGTMLKADAKDSRIRIYTSPQGLGPGECWFDLDDEEFSEIIYSRRYYEAYYDFNYSEEDSKAYADSMHPKDMAALKMAKWYLDTEGFEVYAELPEDYDFSEILDVYDWSSGMITGSDSYWLMRVLKVVDEDKMAWQSVAVPDRPETVIKPHGSLYLNLNMIYNDLYKYAMELLPVLPGYDQMTEEEKMKECDDYAMDYVERFLKAEFYYCEDSPLFRVKMVEKDTDGAKYVWYFPYELARMSWFSFDLTEYVMDSHDYYWCNWTWKSADEVEAEIICYLGEEDGTADTVKITLTGDDIKKTVIQQPTDTTDGIVECIASVTYRENTFTSRVKRFDIEANGEVERLKIESQPASVEVRYPEGATFSVAVDRPWDVVSYQWVMDDGVREYVLDGLTATTDNLVIPSTRMSDPDVTITCIITDINGNRVYTDPVSLSITNHTEYRQPLYVGDRALLPGESLDLSTTGLGTGTVSYDDEHNVTLKDVDITTDGLSFDTMLSPSFGVFWDGRGGDLEPYFMHFVGDCVFENNYFDESINSGGAVINSHFRTEDDKAYRDLTIDVQGTLTVKGGSDAIYSDSNITLSGDCIVTMPMGTNFNRGVVGQTVTVDEDVELDIACVGTAISAQGDLVVMEGAVIDIDYTVPHVHNANTEGNAIIAHGSVLCGPATINVDINAYPEQFEPWGLATAYVDGIRCDGYVVFVGTDVAIRMSAEEGTGPYARNFCGIGGDGLVAVALSDGATVSIDIDSDCIFIADGITPDSFSSDCDVSVGEGCDLDIRVRAMAAVSGIFIPGDVAVKNGTLSVDVATESAYALGIYATGADFYMDDCNYGVEVTASAPNNSDVAIVIPFQYGEWDYFDGYDPSYLIIRGVNNRILSPEGGVVNLFSMDVGDGDLMLCESVYDTADKTEPVAAFSVGVKGYTVSFIENGEVVTKKVNAGEPVSPPSDPVVYGFDFEGWFADEDLTEPFDFTQPIDGDTPVYAGLFKVEYIPEGGSSVGWVNSGSGDGLGIVIHRNRNDETCFGHFCSVTLTDAKGTFETVLKEGEDYTAESGSTRINLTESFLNSLKAGTYTLTVAFDDEEVELNLRISVPSGQDTPFTGVETKMDLYLILIGISALGIVMIAFTNRGRRKRV